jgi:hypothetical protein
VALRHLSLAVSPNSQLGHFRPIDDVRVMSAFADSGLNMCVGHLSFGPGADVKSPR